MKNTPVWLTVPDTLAINNSLSTGYPSIYFNLPTESVDAIILFPRFIIEVRYREAEQSLNDFKLERQRNNYNSGHSEILDLKIDNRSAFERSYNSITIFDFSEGGAAHANISHYELLVENGNELYSCSMADESRNFEESLKIAKSLCYSITFE